MYIQSTLQSIRSRKCVCVCVCVCVCEREREREREGEREGGREGGGEVKMWAIVIDSTLNHAGGQVSWQRDAVQMSHIATTHARHEQTYQLTQLPVQYTHVIQYCYIEQSIGELTIAQNTTSFTIITCNVF